MTRRYRRRKKFFKPKKGTIFSIIAILIFLFSGLLVLSFTQQGSVLDKLKIIRGEYFGTMKYLLPIVSISISLFLANLKIIKLRLNIPIGLILIFLCLLGLSQSGAIGTYIWLTFSQSLSDIGSFMLLTLMLFIGLIVLFNTSIEEITKLADLIFSGVSKLTKTTINKKKPIFVEKLPIKAPVINSGREAARADERNAATAKTKKEEGLVDVTLGTTLVSNVAGTEKVWDYPSLTLLTTSSGQKADRGDMKQNAETIEKTLESFGISARVVEVNLGPAVTQYALEIALGTKLSKITALSNDLALALAAPTGQIRKIG